MRVVFHPAVYADIASVMEYYERVSSEALADAFYSELRARLAEVAANPWIFPVRHGDLRQVNLRRFPHHFLFRVSGDTVRVLVVRHHRRSPDWSLRRD